MKKSASDRRRCTAASYRPVGDESSRRPRAAACDRWRLWRARIIHDGSSRNRGAASRDRRAETRGLAPPLAAVPVPLLLRRGQALKRRAPVPNSTVRVRGASPLAKARRSSGSAIAVEALMNNASREYLAIASLPMPSSTSIRKRGTHERDEESTLCERRVCVPEVSAVVCARKMDRGMASSLPQMRLSRNVNGSLR